MPSPSLTALAAAVLEVEPPERALVVGSGDGDAVFFLAREFPAARVRGFDRDEERVRAAVERVGLDPEGRVAFKAGGGRLPYPDGLFDLVVVADSGLLSAEIARVLRRGGQVVLIGPDPIRRRRGFRRGRGAPGGGVLARALQRGHGLEFGDPVTAGDGSFRVGRLRGEGSAGAAE